MSFPGGPAGTGGEGKRSAGKLLSLGVFLDVAGQVFRGHAPQPADAHGADVAAPHEKAGKGAADVQPPGDFSAVKQGIVHSHAVSRPGMVDHAIII